MDDIDYSRIRVIYVLRLCAVGFALHNVRDIFFRKWPLVVFNISVACHNFKTKARNYSIIMRMPSISFLFHLILLVSSKTLAKVEFQRA